MKEFKLLRGYHKPTLTERFEELLENYQPINLPTLPIMPTIQPIWTGTDYRPTWVVNPGLIQYTPATHTILTTTPGTGTYTIPYSGTINTASSISLTTSNPNGTTYTTGGFGGALTTSTAFFTNTAKL